MPQEIKLKEINSYELACIIARIMDNKQAKDIDILKISNISVVSDYFVICSAMSNVQVRTLSSNILGILKKMYSRLPEKEEADSKNKWHLLDYGDVVVHIMHQEERQYYALEKFWSHACKINTEEWMKETMDLSFENI